MRTICGCNNHSSKLLLYIDTNLQPLSIRRKFHRLVHFFKIKKNLSASHLNNMLHSYITHTRHPLRNNNYFRTALARTETFKSSFFPNTVKDLNIFNPIVKSSTSIGMFKPRLRTEIFSVDQQCFDYNYLGTRKVNALNSASCDCGKSDETYFHYFLSVNIIQRLEMHFYRKQFL